VIYSTVEPCVMCLGSIVMADVGYVVFGAFDAARGGTEMYTRVGYVQSHVRHYVGGVLEAECEAMFARRTDWRPHGRLPDAGGRP
jgi:tRNA(adenine34) deaminase